MHIIANNGDAVAHGGLSCRRHPILLIVAKSQRRAILKNHIIGDRLLYGIHLVVITIP